MKLRQWFSRLCYFLKIESSLLPKYLNDLIPKPSLHYTNIFHFSLILKLEPTFLGIRFFHILYHKVI